MIYEQKKKKDSRVLVIERKLHFKLAISIE